MDPATNRSRKHSTSSKFAIAARLSSSKARETPTMASSSEYEVSMTTLISSFSCLILRQASTPEPSGRRMSIKTTLGVS